MKKLLTTLFAAAIVVANISPVSAAEIVTETEDGMVTLNGVENKALDDLLRYTPCPGGGKHTMYGRGIAIAHKGSASENPPVFFKGQATQCTKCWTVLATEINPYAHPLYLGWYTMVGGFNQDIGNLPHHIYSDQYWYNDDFLNDEFFRSFDFLY